MNPPDPITIRGGVDQVGVPGVHELVADVFVDPASVPDHPTVMFCVPGGGISRRYFDLDVPPETGDYSMARHLARHGTIVVTIDPPAVGDSDRPDDGYTLTPTIVAEMLDRVAASTLGRLRRGTIAEHVPPFPHLRAVGVGHSAGGLLTAIQQHRHRSYDAIAVLGFGGAGLPEFLDERELEYAGNPAALREVVGSLAAARFGDPLPVLANGTSELLVKPTPPPEVLTALGRATAPLLALVGITAIIPGSVSDSTQSIDVPVFIGVGEFDIAASPHVIAGEFGASMDVTLFGLAGAGHNHNVAESRSRLWDRLLLWSRSMEQLSAIVEESGT